MDDSIRELLNSSRQRKIQHQAKGRSKPAPPTHGVEKLADERIEEAQRRGQFDDLSGKHRQTQPPLTAQRVGTIAEQRIEAAMRDGEFDNLPGMGKPLDLFDDAHVPAEMRMAFRLMKGKGMEALWSGPQRDFERQMGMYQGWFSDMQQLWPELSSGQREGVRQELSKRLKDLNDLIHAINAAVPTDAMRLGLLNYERELQRLGA